MQELKSALKQACKNLFQSDIDPELSRPAELFGDYSTNAALQLAPKANKPAPEIAQQLSAELSKIDFVESAEPAGPGFINIKLTDDYLWQIISDVNDKFGTNDSMAGQVIVLEHTDPNPFKEFHIGHAYSNTIGTSIGKMLAAAGAEVHQVSYHGDVGLHIAMAIYGLKNGEDSYDLGGAYAFGAEAYKNKPEAQQQIDAINSRLYEKDNPEINELYDRGRQQSLKAFEEIYRKLDTHFEKNYFESQVAPKGVEVVKQNIGKVFTESDGAVIFDGEKLGLHKRVFITKQGLPTYEAKEIGLAFAKDRDYPAASSFLVITANEIDDYFRVLIAAIKEIDNSLGEKIKHLSHGVVKFPEGKMSSRTGNVKLLTDLESDVANKINEKYGENKDQAAVVYGAIKYEFLKHRIGGDFVFEVDESINLQGNSGPYLQYALVRAKSILKKASENTSNFNGDLEPVERSLARKISEFPEVVEQASDQLMPNHISNYLYELAQNFNSFYETNRVVGDSRESTRTKLVKAYCQTLNNGLGLLNIEAPERM